MPHKGLYAVLIPFEVTSKEVRRDVWDDATALLKRLGKNKKRDIYGQVLTPDTMISSNFPSQPPDDSVVYVSGHGNTDWIGTSGAVKKDQANLSPALLAGVMHDVLPRTMAHLKLMTCNSGTGYSENASFVQRMCAAMANSGFQNLTVYGYCGYTSEKGDKVYPEYKKFTGGVAASAARIAYNITMNKIIAVPTAKKFQEEID